MGKVYCDSCKKRCRGNVLKANEKFFHKDCFTCSECKCNLKAGGFFFKDNKYYCRKDYLKLSQPKCKVCCEILNGETVSALSYSFHKGCFICCQCKTPFNPGNRVTVWKDEFYCMCCSQSLITTSRPTRIGSGDEKRVTSPLTAAKKQYQHHHHHQSVFNQPSPVSFTESTDSRTETAAPMAKTNQNGSGILKSSLRQSLTLQSARTPVYTNGDTILLENHPHSQRHQTESSTLPVESVQGEMHRTTTPQSRALSPQFSRSLHGSARYPLSEYGRFYNLSYASIDEQASRRSTDAYRRSGLHNLIGSNSTSHPQHFHLPHGSRFSLEPNRIVPEGMSRTSRSFNSSLRDAIRHMEEPVVRKIGPVSPQYATPGTRLYSSASPPPPLQSADQEVLNKHHPTLVESEAAGLEARRLASFPSGQPPEESCVPAIERYDWPAPAAVAVMTAEMMRERRQKLREQGVLNDGSDESVEDLSIDASIGSHSEFDRPSSGIAKAIQLERERARRSRTQAPHIRDPISASRAPNAKVEPPYKTRYATHSFASPSRESHRSSVSPHRFGYSLELVNLGNRVWTTGEQTGGHCQRQLVLPRHTESLRPGYTAGQLSLTTPSKSSSIPGAHFVSPCLGTTPSNGHRNGTIQEENQHDPIASKFSPVRTNGLRVMNGGGLSCFSRNVDCDSNHPRMLCSSTPCAASATPEEFPVKKIAYKDLVVSLGKPLKGIDRSRLEVYLSNEEFENIFKLSRVAFYRLPEWKRNDLKRRADLF